MQLTQAILFVVDMQRMADFYGAALGLPVHDGSVESGWLRLQAGGCLLALHRIPEAFAASIDVDREREGTPIKLGFHVDDLDAARAEMVARGVKMRETHRFEGIAFCDGIDPEGNVFQLTTR